jgi:outer membrane lipoprotein-sorting protein
MKSELRCDEVRPEISAFLDRELDAVTAAEVSRHLESCADCRTYSRRIAGIRRQLRVQPAGPVPDLTSRILERIEESTVSQFPLRSALRTAAIGAAAAFLIFAGAFGNFLSNRSDVATAAEIARFVRAAARDLSAYHATFAIIERGWHQKVPVRRLQAEVWFSAPERFRLQVNDVTRYPAGNWPHNDVQLIASPKRWWIREPSSCPKGSLPGCAVPRLSEERTIVRRPPFDGNSALPTDIAIPLETLSSADRLDVVGSSEIRGRTAIRVRLPYQQAVPLVRALQPGGSWRDFHALDQVDVWIDEETWFPLRYRVTAGTSADRELWAERIGLPEEEAGRVLLDVRAVEFSEPARLDASLFRSRVSGAVADAGFQGSEDLDAKPHYTAGLEPYRAGAADDTAVLSFVDGMTWLKVASAPSGRVPLAYQSAAELVDLGRAGVGFYQPAGLTTGRKIDVYGSRHVHVETNLPRAQLVKVAASLPVRGRSPESIRGPGGVVVRRVDAHLGAEVGYLPEGYRVGATLVSTSKDGTRTVTTYFRRSEAEYEGFGIRIVETDGVEVLTPSSEEFVNVRIGGSIGRWSFERSELEWVEDKKYRAVAVPSGDLATALAIAEELR